MKSDENINKITEKIIGCSFEVSNTLGCGFLEKVYKNALILELKSNGCLVESQKQITVRYKGHEIGSYYPDLVVDDCIIVELKSQKSIENIHLAQVMNYLRACNFKYGLIINFGNPKVQVKRIVI